MFCSQCGRGQPDDTRFCEGCGAPMGSGAPTPGTPPPPTPPTGAAAGPPLGPITISADELYVDDTARPTPRRSGRLVAAGVGAVALVMIGYVLVGNLRGTGAGADSPEGAVTGLASAISDEDAIDALSMVAPDEISSLDSLFDDAAGAGAGSGLVESSSSPFTGIDVEASPGELDVTELGDGVAKVDIEGTTGSWRFSPDDLAPRAQDVLEDEGADLEPESEEGQIDEDITCYDDDTGEEEAENAFVVTVQRGGRWYVSPLYTLAEYLLLCADLPGGDFDESVGADLDGATSPEGAVEQLVGAVARQDVDEAIDLLSGGDLRVLVDYSDAIRELVDDEVSPEFSLSVDDLSLDAEPLDDGRARVVIDHAALSYSQYDDDGDSTTGQIEISGTCASESGEETYEYESYDAYYDDYYTDTDTDYFESSGCLEDGLGDAAPDETFVVAVERDGEWFVSPIETALEWGRVLLDNGIVDEIESGDLSVDE